MKYALELINPLFDPRERNRSEYAPVIKILSRILIPIPANAAILAVYPDIGPQYISRIERLTSILFNLYDTQRQRFSSPRSRGRAGPAEMPRDSCPEAYRRAGNQSDRFSQPAAPERLSKAHKPEIKSRRSAIRLKN
jgi:hypothetical protein